MPLIYLEFSSKTNAIIVDSYLRGTKIEQFYFSRIILRVWL